MIKMKLTCIIVLLGLLFILPVQGQQKPQAEQKYIIDTIVGNMNEGYNGDSILALNASLYTPSAVCVDEFDRIYIADTQNNRIRMIDEYSVIETVAGSGIFGFSGNEKLATKAALAFPGGVHVVTKDKEKKLVNIYISDTRNNSIRMVNEYGIMIPIAGTSRYGFSGDHGPAEKADFKWPSQIAMDLNNNIYIADTYNNRIRVIYRGGKIAGDAQKRIITEPEVGMIYTLAGTGKKGYGGDTGPADEAHLNRPVDMCPVGDELYISDHGNHIVRKIAADGTITTLGGRPGEAGYYGDNRAATNEKLNTTYGIWADATAVYIADGMNSRIRHIKLSDNFITTFAGNGEFGFAGDGAEATKSMMSHPVDIFGDGKGVFYLADLENQLIRVIMTKAAKKAKQGQ